MEKKKKGYEEQTLVARWQLGKLFLAYGDTERMIAKAVGKSQPYVHRHRRVAETIPD